MKVEGFYGGFKFPLKEKGQTKEEKGFLEFLKEKVEEVDRDQKVAAEKLEKFAAGEDKDLTGLVLSLTKAELSFRLLLRVRNKVIEAYQEVMRMQI